MIRSQHPNRSGSAHRLLVATMLLALPLLVASYTLAQVETQIEGRQPDRTESQTTPRQADRERDQSRPSNQRGVPTTKHRSEDGPHDAGYVHVEILGKLEAGVAAIGGETTGFTITARDITWELDFGQQALWIQRAQAMDGHMVVVRGALERREGVEIENRWIVHVRQFRVVQRSVR